MTPVPSVPTPHSIPTYLEDGAQIATILLFWSTIAGLFIYGLGSLGSGGIIEAIATQIGTLFVLVGLLNAVGFLSYRAIDYWNSYT